jgi:ABC-type multidrug transport system ATPase subunit
MGPSGSGKSTMMNVLACRSNGIKSDGTKVIDGSGYSQTELKRVSGYVMQVDSNIQIFNFICWMLIKYDQSILFLT